MMEDCVILLDKRDEHDAYWCRTCEQHIRLLPRSARAQFEGEQPQHVCPQNLAPQSGKA